MSRKRKPSAIKALKEYCERHWTDVDWKNNDSDLVAESDRSFIILSATKVEMALRFKITDAMPSLTVDLEKQLFEPYKPLSTFNALIDIGHAFGLVEKDHAQRMHYLREIRNQCAHANQHLSFAVAELRAATHLIAPDEISNRLALAMDKNTARTNFMGVTTYLAAVLYLGKDAAMNGFEELFISDLDQ